MSWYSIKFSDEGYFSRIDPAKAFRCTAATTDAVAKFYDVASERYPGLSDISLFATAGVMIPAAAAGLAVDGVRTGFDFLKYMTGEQRARYFREAAAVKHRVQETVSDVAGSVRDTIDAVVADPVGAARSATVMGATAAATVTPLAAAQSTASSGPEDAGVEGIIQAEDHSAVDPVEATDDSTREA